MNPANFVYKYIRAKHAFLLNSGACVDHVSSLSSPFPQKHFADSEGEIKCYSSFSNHVTMVFLSSTELGNCFGEQASFTEDK